MTVLKTEEIEFFSLKTKTYPVETAHKVAESAMSILTCAAAVVKTITLQCRALGTCLYLTHNAVAVSHQQVALQAEF